MKNTNEIGTEGIFLIKKPKGVSSLEFLGKIKNIIGERKVGHAGTLDPNASGLMVILSGAATKKADQFRSLDKEYIGLIKFHKNVEKEKVEKIFSELEGKVVEQLPPKRSAVARKLRKRKINSLEILDFDGRSLKFRINCEAGFYVRKFAVDVGRKLGVGAHLQELERTKIGDFCLENAVLIEDLKK